MISYETTRRLFPIIEVICAGVFLAGLIIFVAALANTGGSFAPQYFITGSAALLGLFLSFVALLGFVSSQVARAIVDTAEFSQQSLQVARDQLETSRQLLRATHQKPQTYTASAEAKPKRSEPNDIPTYASEAKQQPDTKPQVTGYHHRGHTIERVDGEFLVAGSSFANFGAAKAHVDELLDAQSEKPKALEP